MIDEVIAGLKARGLRIATAESCTGGRVAAALTGAAGASDYFVGGVVAYSNEVKASVLGVSREDLAQFGAVSRQVAEGMALGALRVFDADVAIATTGIAGPGGGTPEKPVGTVWVAIGRNADSRSCGADTGPKEAGAGPKEAGAGPKEAGAGPKEAGAGPKEAGAAVEARLFRFEGSREENMASAVEAALGMVLERLA